MISLDRNELSEQFRNIEDASVAFDDCAAASPSEVDGGPATAALLDMLTTFSHVALLAVQHLDATVVLGRQASADIAALEDAASQEVSALHQRMV